MLFVVHYEVTPANRNNVHERVRKAGIVVPVGMKLIANYHSVTQLEGWSIVEGSSTEDLWNLFEGWTDLNINTITPVLSNDELVKLV